ncbi:dihydropyrimidine dehydrogenase [Lutibacter profundi]|uniref:Dihydropyrimidine dehydrogenase n=1 Tax=Lutibacter profundi TaxID=1622118 RepID=A0A0X8G769_9FLAO|nr:NADPH-dependent glutamate synthase [Lutibacter profundi]AMC10898.1 dihydropyrimidine dehydrogenase [Lutibacter profundi]
MTKELDKEYYKAERKAEWRNKLRKEIKSKERTNVVRVHMPEADPNVRNKSNIEVNKGLTLEMAVSESSRCLDCVVPTCVSGCPVGTNIPKFVKYIESGDILGAAKVLKENNSLPAICGRVCPQEIQCEAQCVYVKKLSKEGSAIGYLERFAADYERESGNSSIPELASPNGIKMAVIGSGPAGLTVAGELAKFGYDVTVFEALHDLGGVLKYGIPEFRLPKDIVDFEINTIKQMGVKFITNFIVGKTASINDLKNEGFKAFFVASGAGLPNFMNIPGENFNGIQSANEFLTRVNLMNGADANFDTPVHTGKNVVIVGGGNTAMDSVRTAKRMGAERAMIVYRRSQEEMPARAEEVKHAIEEGIEFINLASPIEYFANVNGMVTKMRVQKMQLGEPDASGRRRPQPIEGSEYDIDVDSVIIAVGVSPNPIIQQSMPDLEVTKWNTIKVDENMMTSIPGLFAGGDIVRGGATVILAMGDGRKAAQGMHKYINETILAEV